MKALKPVILNHLQNQGDLTKKNPTHQKTKICTK